LNLSLTPHGRLALIHDDDASSLDSRLQDCLRAALERGSGHGILLLGADEVGTALPPVYSYWREFGARYVTAVCTRQEDAGRVGMAAPQPKNWSALRLQRCR
jgi:non-specific serine/threonine protein kinase